MNVLVLLLLGIAIIIIIYLISRVVWWFINTTTTLTTLNSGKELKTIKGSKLPNYNSNFNFTYSLWLNIDDWSYRYGEQKVILQRKFKTSLFCPKIYLDSTNNTINIQYTYILPGTNNSNPVTKTQTKHLDSATELNTFFTDNSSPTIKSDNKYIENTASAYGISTQSTHITSPEYTNTVSLIQAINTQGTNNWGDFTSSSTEFTDALNQKQIIDKVTTAFESTMNTAMSSSANSLTYASYIKLFTTPVPTTPAPTTPAPTTPAPTTPGTTAYNNLKKSNPTQKTLLLTSIIFNYIIQDLGLYIAIANTELNNKTSPIINISSSLIYFVATLNIIYNILKSVSDPEITTVLPIAITYLYKKNPTYKSTISLPDSNPNSLNSILTNILLISPTSPSTIITEVNSLLAEEISPSANTNYCQLNDIFIDYNINAAVQSQGTTSNALGLPSYYNPNHGFDTMNEAITYCNNGTSCGYVTYNPDTKKYYLRSGAQGSTNSSLTYFKQDAKTYMRNGDTTSYGSPVLTSYCKDFGNNAYTIASNASQINSEQSTSIQYSHSMASLDMVPLQEWFNIIFSFNQNMLDIYLNGKLVKSEILPGNIYNCTSNSNITITPNGGFDGWTSSIQYLDDAVSPEQAYNMYNTGFGGGIFGSLFDKYKVKFTFMHGNVEDGSYTI